MAFALLVSACGGSGSSTEPEPVDPATVDTVAAEAPEACPDAVNAAPEKLPVGEVRELSDNGAVHVVCASYDHTPPASGDHFQVWQNCGIYTQPIQNQTAVHSLEHGAVWVAYQPDLDASLIQAMTERLKSEKFALMAPYPGLQNPIVLTAWTRQLAVDDWSDPAIEEFLDTYFGRYSPGCTRSGRILWPSRWLRPHRPELELSRDS